MLERVLRGVLVTHVQRVHEVFVVSHNLRREVSTILLILEDHLEDGVDLLIRYLLPLLGKRCTRLHSCKPLQLLFLVFAFLASHVRVCRVTALVLIADCDDFLRDFSLLARSVHVADFHDDVLLDIIIVAASDLVEELTQLATIDQLHFYKMLWSQYFFQVSILVDFQLIIEQEQIVVLLELVLVDLGDAVVIGGHLIAR